VVEESNIPTIWSRKLYNEYHMSSLRRLDLTESMTQTIEDDSFYQMSRLQNLNLSHNLLSRLEGEQLNHLTALQSLDLSFNRLTWLGAGLLQNSSFLSNLYLQGNNLVTLLPDFLPSTGRLKLLQLEGNPWQCDCRLLHLPPLASAPPCDKLQDCPARVIALTKVSEAPTLQCHVSGWPRPQVTWWKDGNLVDPEAAKETEEMLRKPVHIFSALPDPQPGNYTCQAGESSTSIMVASKPVSGHPIILVVVVAASTSLLLLLLFLLLFYLWRRSNARKEEEDRGLTTSLAGLEYRSTKLSTTNPVPKPPRTFTSLALVEPPPLVKGVTFPPSAPHFDNKPRSRASIGTVSLNSTFFEASPCVSPRNSSHPCCGAPPGYATLPKRFTAPPLGPRCSGDGSSFASLNLTCGPVAPITPLPISAPVNALTTPINTSGLPPSYSPMPPCSLQTIQEQE